MKKSLGLCLILVWLVVLHGPVWAKNLHRFEYASDAQVYTLEKVMFEAPAFHPVLVTGLAPELEMPESLFLPGVALLGVVLLSFPALPFFIAGKPLEGSLYIPFSLVISFLSAIVAAIIGWVIGIAIILGELEKTALQGGAKPLSLIFGLFFSIPFAVGGFILSQIVMFVLGIQQNNQPQSGPFSVQLLKLEWRGF